MNRAHGGTASSWFGYARYFQIEMRWNQRKDEPIPLPIKNPMTPWGRHGATFQPGEISVLHDVSWLDVLRLTSLNKALIVLLELLTHQQSRAVEPALYGWNREVKHLSDSLI